MTGWVAEGCSAREDSPGIGVVAMRLCMARVSRAAQCMHADQARTLLLPLGAGAKQGAPLDHPGELSEG